MMTTAAHIHTAPGVPRKVRSHSAPPFELTERDLEVLKAVYYFRVLDETQIARLFFPSADRAYRRLYRLYLHGYLERIDWPQYPGMPQPAPAYRLALLGARKLADLAGVPLDEFTYWGKGDDRDRHPTRVTDYFLEHALALSEFRMAMEQAVVRNQCRIERWLDDVDMRAAERGHTTVFEPVVGAGSVTLRVKPDGYFALSTAQGQRAHFFVEVDRGSETVSKAWKRKALAYKGLFTSGTFHETFGVGDRAVRFRVLVTTPSLTRTQNIQAVIAKHGKAELSDLFLFTPFQDFLTHNPLTTPIWHRKGTTGAQALL